MPRALFSRRLVRAIASRASTWVAVVALASAFAAPAPAAPRSAETPQEHCASFPDQKDRAQCCYDFFMQCVQTCPRDGNGNPDPGCARFCEATVMEPCLGKQQSRPGSGPAWSAPSQAGGAALTAPRAPRGRKAPLQPKLGGAALLTR